MKLTAFDRNPSQALEYAQQKCAERDALAPEPTRPRPDEHLHRLAKAHGITYRTLRRRMRKHPEWTPEQAAVKHRPAPFNVGVSTNPDYTARFGMSLAAWADKHGVSVHTVRGRLRRHPEWTNKQLLAEFTPTSPKGDHIERLGMTATAFAELHEIKLSILCQRMTKHPEWSVAQLIDPPGKEHPMLGMSVRAFAKKHGISHSTLMQRMAKHPEWTVEQLINPPARVHPRLGMTIADFAKKHGIGASTVQTRLANHPEWTAEQVLNYTRRPPRVEPAGEYIQMSPTLVARIRRDLLDGAGVRETARRYGHSIAHISRIKHYKVWKDIPPAEAQAA